MIFNYHFVEITSLAGFTSWGEFEDMDAMVSKLEELRLKGELLAVDHSVLMKCFTRFSKEGVKQTGAYRLSYINDGWSLQLGLPKSVKAGKSRKSSI